MSVNIAGGSWFTSEGLTTAATLPLTVSTPTVLYPAAPASVTVTMTAGSVSKTVGMNVVAGCAEMVRMTDYISATELPSAATVGVAAAAFAPITGSGTYASIARPGLDNAAAQRDAAYRPWVNQCTSAAVPRVVITGHSVVASSGATGGIGFVEHIQGVGTGVGNALSHWVPNVVVDKDGHNGWTTYRIADPGRGFNLDALPHAAVGYPPSEPFGHVKVREEKGLRAGGFGILLARSMVDELLYNEARNEVVFVKYLD